VKSFPTFVLCVFSLSALLVLPAAVDGKSRVKETVSLAAGEPLLLSVGDLSACAQWNCWIKLSPYSGRGDDLVRIKVEADGSWVAYEAEEKDDKNKSGEEEGDDDDSADAEAGDDDDSADWRDKPLLTRDQRIKKQLKKEMGPFKVELAKGQVSGGKYSAVTADMAGGPAKSDEQPTETGVATAKAGDESSSAELEIPVDIVPEGAFILSTNGYFGISYGSVKVGSGEQSGVIRIKR
tara:strand:- start:219 stop:929 length:711 start_codon:yes stop_codon:yes gene_type:complete